MMAMTVALSAFLYQMGRRQTAKQLEAWSQAKRSLQPFPVVPTTVMIRPLILSGGWEGALK